MPTTEPRPLLRMPAVAQRLGIALRTAYSLVEDGLLPSVRVSRRGVRVDPQDLEDFVASRRSEARAG